MRHSRIPNVLLLTDGFSDGGAEKKLLELATFLDKKKYNVTVCSLGMGDQLRDEFEKLPLKVIVFTRRRKFDLHLFFDIVRLMKNESIDLVQSILLYGDVMGPLAAKLAGVPTALSWETISSPEWLRLDRLMVYRFAVRFCDRVIAVSEATKEFLIKDRGVKWKKITTIPYGVDLSVYFPRDGEQIRNEWNLSVSDPAIGVVGRLHIQKGHTYLIKAADQVLKTHPTARFVVIGDGYLKDSLLREVQDFGLESHFVFEGYRSDIERAYNAFDVFVLPSLYEGLPNVLLEAMACAKPVVATAVDGSSEAVVDGVTGFLVPPRDEDRLASKIALLLDDWKLRVRMGNEGRKRVEQCFTLSKQIEQFQNLYDSCIQKNGVNSSW